MPIYTYRCEECGTAAEHLSSYADRDAPRTCEHDGKAMVRAVVEAPNFGRDTGRGRVVLANGERVRGEFVSQRRG